jgi:hypothetical protein
LISGDDCAIAGEAIAVAAAPAAETFKKSRRFIQALLEGVSWNFLERVQRRREFTSAGGAPVQGSLTRISGSGNATNA